MVRATMVALALVAVTGRATAGPDAGAGASAPAARLGAAYAAYEAGDLDLARRAVDGLRPDQLANPD